MNETEIKNSQVGLWDFYRNSEPQSGANELMELPQHPSLNSVFFLLVYIAATAQADCKIMAGSKRPLCSINYASWPV